MERERISTATGFLMMSIAIFFDVLQFIMDLLFIGLVVNTIILTPLAWLTFYVWFKIRGVNFSDSARKLGTMTVAGLIELIPILNALPAWTLSIGMTIAIVKGEDAVYNKTHKEDGRISPKQIVKAVRSAQQSAQAI